MSKKTLLVIAAVAVMLLGATSAYGYYETWDGWWSSGTIEYDENTYTHSGEGFMIRDSTYSETRDTFYFSSGAVNLMPFVCDDVNPPDTIFLALPLSGTYGGKPTGQSGEKYGIGEWSGTGYDHELVKIFDIEGTWTGTFNYTDRPYIYTAVAYSTWSSPPGITAIVYSYGDQD